ncbi:hypothetical protein Hypma_014468 [Hypsizygus marmoreus]|uniref:Uncharacterized protein n=1 Tax=Hypsizygus marmoreus TaxID=39966 RepID=A0A369JJL1_HYPMA|nr:hypothetical protein Hypma_014468 [Hypsizygus marmoreus]
MPLLSVPVPVEIIDTIIDDTDALRNCSLVAQAFRPCSQKDLYTSVEIRFPDQPSSEHQPRGLLEVLLDRPRLARGPSRNVGT